MAVALDELEVPLAEVPEALAPELVALAEALTGGAGVAKKKPV